MDGLTLFNFGFSGTSQALTHASNVDGDVVFQVDGGASLVIRDIMTAELTNDLKILF